MTNAARSIWPHLQSDQPPKQQQRAQRLETLFPRPQPKPPSSPYSDRDSLLRHLRALNARIDARMKGS